MNPTEQSDINQFNIPEEFRGQFKRNPETSSNDSLETIESTDNPEELEGQAEPAQEESEVERIRAHIREIGGIASSGEDQLGHNSSAEQTTTMDYREATGDGASSTEQVIGVNGLPERKANHTEEEMTPEQAAREATFVSVELDRRRGVQ